MIGCRFRFAPKFVIRLVAKELINLPLRGLKVNRVRNRSILYYTVCSKACNEPARYGWVEAASILTSYLPRWQS